MVTKKVGLIGIIVLTFLVIGCIGSNAPAATDCGSDKACFVNAIKNCSDSSFTISNENTSFDIVLSKAADNLCRYQITLTSSSKRPEAVGKSAICESYNSMDAAKSVSPDSSYHVAFPADNIYNDPSQLNTTVINVMLLFANCSGPLFDDVKAAIENKTTTGNPTEEAKTCSDGTEYNKCSANKPKYCSNGELINQCRWCGCPSVDYIACNTSSQTCYIQTCDDGTPAGQCNSHYLYCTPPFGVAGSPGFLMEKCSVCGCQAGLRCNQTSNRCYGIPISQNYSNASSGERCWDNTLYGQCSAIQPRYCDNGILINNCKTCGCWGINTICNASSNHCDMLTCQDGTRYGDCSANMPKYCNEHGQLVDECGACGCPNHENCALNGSCSTQPYYSLNLVRMYISGSVCYAMDLTNNGMYTIHSFPWVNVRYPNDSFTGIYCNLTSNLTTGAIGNCAFYPNNLTAGEYLLRVAEVPAPDMYFSCSP